jgi:hypothetical protein
MASLQERNGSYRFIFRFPSKQHFVTIGKVSREEAEAKAAQVEYLLLRLKQELITLPPGVAIVQFLQGDGRSPVARNGVVATPEKLTLGSFRDRYLETHGNDTLEERTLDGIRLHFKHLVSALGETFPIGDLALSERHSFISACASKGIDQWLIQEWVGHLTDEVHKRYSHLYPSVQAEAIKSVFG